MLRGLSLCALALWTGGCAGPEGDSVLDVLYDPCDSLVVVAGDGARAEEVDSIGDALAMWNETAATRLSAEPDPGAPRLLVRFEEAAPLFHGVYDDERGEVIINRALSGSHERAVTIAHELGHAFGFWHVDAGERRSVMNDGNLEIEPTAGDARALHELWGDCSAR